MKDKTVSILKSLWRVSVKQLWRQAKYLLPIFKHPIMEAACECTHVCVLCYRQKGQTLSLIHILRVKLEILGKNPEIAATVQAS